MTLFVNGAMTGPHQRTTRAVGTGTATPAITSTAELGGDQRFDWLADAWDQLIWRRLTESARLLLERHGDPAAGLRLLISRAEAGPAGTLQTQMADPSELDALAAQEQHWLQRLRPDPGAGSDRLEPAA